MCGIAGYIGNGTPEQLRKMKAAIAHRGPDDEGFYEDRGIGFAHARLSIIDLSPGGHQPKFLPDQSVGIVFNGEIFNYQELRAELREGGFQFQSQSDTEVLLALYDKFGEDFLARAVGQFAIALYDFKKNKLILARDRIGEKPLYYYQSDKTLYFASELGALLESGAVPRKIDLESVEKYLLFDYVPTPYSMIAGVKKVPPASLVIFENGNVREKTFWSPPKLTECAEDAAIIRLDEQLTKSVARTMVSDVPLGVFLSGGIDSSAIAYYAQKASSRPIETFSIGFTEKAFDESSYARQVAQALGTNHHEEILNSDDALALVPEIASTFSEPVADASVLPTLLLSRFAKQHVTVALGGDGGDELFAGYPTFFAEQIIPLWLSLPKAVQRGFAALIESLPASSANFALSYNLKKLISSNETDSVLRHQEWLGSFPGNERARILGPAFSNHTSTDWKSPIISYASEIDSDAGNKLLYTYLRTYLMDEVLVKVDRASMHYALETRAPFLDRDVVDLVFSLPYELKYKNGTNKYLLKKVLAGKIPDDIINRKKKGFGIPLAQWLSGPLRPLCEELLSTSALSHGLFNATGARRLMDQHFSGARDNRKELWNLIVFQLWYNRWMR